LELLLTLIILHLLAFQMQCIIEQSPIGVYCADAVSAGLEAANLDGGSVMHDRATGNPVYSPVPNERFEAIKEKNKDKIVKQ